MKDSSKYFKIEEIDFNKIRVSEKRLYSKKYNSYKYYVLYEHDNECIPLRVILKGVVGYYSVYNDNKKKNFSVKDKRINILEHIGEKLEVTLADFTYEKKGESTLEQQYLMKPLLKKTLSLL